MTQQDFAKLVATDIRGLVAQGERLGGDALTPGPRGSASDHDVPAPNNAEIEAAARYSTRPITSAECYDMAGKDWMPAAGREVLIRAARTIAALTKGRA